MAQERKKRRIVLTSVLKPVDDSRMLEKMGTSLARHGDEVFIIGYPSLVTIQPQGIQLLGLAPFKRLSFSRMLAKWTIFRKLLKLRPAVIIFNTHELILPCVLLKIIMDVKIVYDVRENYYRNILYSGSFPFFIRWPLALVVRFKEKLLAPAIDHFLLAEKGYEKEFRFHRGGWTVIENKTVDFPVQVKLIDQGKIRLLFSGTLAESTGVFQAISLAVELHKLDPGIQLTVIGYAALDSVRKKLNETIRNHPWINLIGVNRLVPHKIILDAIQHADAGILLYPQAAHTLNSHPTKLFEYLHARLPVILENHWPWIERYASCKPFIFFNSQQPEYTGLLTALKNEKFYVSLPRDVTWASEEKKLFEAIVQLRQDKL